MLEYPEKWYAGWLYTALADSVYGLPLRWRAADRAVLVAVRTERVWGGGSDFFRFGRKRA